MEIKFKDQTATMEPEIIKIMEFLSKVYPRNQNMAKGTIIIIQQVSETMWLLAPVASGDVELINIYNLYI